MLFIISPHAVRFLLCYSSCYVHLATLDGRYALHLSFYSLFFRLVDVSRSTNGFSKLFIAQAFGTTTDTVRKLVRCYKRYGEKGLKDKSRRLHTSIQIGTKGVVDGDTLPAEIYCHFLELRALGVPMNQFTAIDIRTLNTFLAYGEEKSFANGWLFIILVILWLRAFGIKGKIVMQSDWGEENGGKSQRKIERMNKALAKLGAEITQIQKRKKEQNGYVERSHWTDDEEFYIPYGGEINGADSLFDYAYGWVRYYNTRRPHYGKGLDGLTPLEYLKTIMPDVDSRIVLMSPLFLDRITSHPDWKGGYDVCGHYEK